MNQRGAGQSLGMWLSWVVKRVKETRRLCEKWGCLCSWGQAQCAAGAGTTARGCRKALKGQQGPNPAQDIDDLPGPSHLPLVLQLQLAALFIRCILLLWGRGVTVPGPAQGHLSKDPSSPVPRDRPGPPPPCHRQLWLSPASPDQEQSCRIPANPRSPRKVAGGEGRDPSSSWGKIAFIYGSIPQTHPSMTIPLVTPKLASTMGGAGSVL